MDIKISILKVYDCMSFIVFLSVYLIKMGKCRDQNFPSIGLAILHENYKRGFTHLVGFVGMELL